MREEIIIEYNFRITATKEEHEKYRERFLNIKDDLDVANNGNASDIEHYRKSLIINNFNPGHYPATIETIGDQRITGVKVA